MRLAELTIKKRGKEMRALCPNCSHDRKKDKDPCLAVNSDTGAYYCHHCGISGLLDDHKDETYEPIEPQEAELKGEHYEYLKGRGISLDTIKKFGITSSKNWIAFNYYQFDEIVNIKYRHATEKRWMQHKGGKPIFYNANSIGKELIIVEGEFDALSFAEAGFDSVVSVPMGAPNESDKNVDGKLKCLQFAENEITKCDRVYLACDNDPNGRRLTTELSRRIGVEKCYTVEYPEGCKDANDVLLTYGADLLRQLIDEAKPFPIDGVSRALDYKDQVLDIYRNGYEDGLTFGYDNFDAFFKFQAGYLVTVTGIPTHGKSNFVEQMMVKLAARHGVKFGIFSPEHYPPQHFLQRLVRIYIGKPMMGLGKMTEMELDAAMHFLNNHFFIIHNNDEHTLDAILSTAKQLVFRHGIKALVIDPWTDIEHEIPRGDNETRYVAQSLAKIKKFNRFHIVTTFLIAHPTKMQKDEDGSYKVPTMYDISGSANFYNKSDFGMTVYRNQDNSVDVHIQKVKFEGVLGQKGTAAFTFDTAASRYYELGQQRNGIESAPLKKIKYDEDVPF